MTLQNTRGLAASSKRAVNVRTLCFGLLVSAMLVAPATAQDEDTRPALPTVYGDTGLWFLSTADVLPKGKVSGSLFLENEHRSQGVTRLVYFGPTIAFGVSNRLELFGSWRGGAVERDLRPIFTGAAYGGVAQDAPFVRQGWTGLKSGPAYVGAKVNFMSQSREDAISLGLRSMLKLPTGSKLIHDGKTHAMFELIASGEAGPVELTASGGFLWRQKLDEFRTTGHSTTVGVGASFPSRSPLRAIVEASGEYVNDWKKNGVLTLLQPGYITGLDGSRPPLRSIVDDVGHLRAGLVWQGSKGWFVHGGFSYALTYASADITTVDEPGSPWGYDVRIGFHPGAKKYVAPPPPPPTPVAAAPAPAPAPAPAAPPPNQNPSVTVNCNPCTVEVGKQLSLSATATDPDKDAVTLTWSAPSGTFNPQTGTSTTWTAPMQPGTVPLTATARDARGGVSAATAQAQVTRPPVKTFSFDDVHFDFDKYNLKPEALRILDDAVTTLRENPDVRLTIEGHCDSMGTVEYNLALGERRANTARDYLVSRGIAANRFESVSFGEERPKADNSSAEGRAMNRRAALVVKIQ